MPIRQTDSHSGAILFVPTPEEAGVQALRTELEEELAKIKAIREGLEETQAKQTQSKSK